MIWYFALRRALPQDRSVCLIFIISPAPGSGLVGRTAVSSNYLQIQIYKGIRTNLQGIEMSVA